MESEAYVYNGTVVVKTGRVAKKEITSTRRTRTTTADELYEITPQDIEEGSWKKWVHLSELYLIVDSGDTNE